MLFTIPAEHEVKGQQGASCVEELSSCRFAGVDLGGHLRMRRFLSRHSP